jgi:hypothetical protein
LIDDGDWIGDCHWGLTVRVKGKILRHMLHEGYGWILPQKKGWIEFCTVVVEEVSNGFVHTHNKMNSVGLI